MQRFTSLLSHGGRHPGARPARIKVRRPHRYRPHLEALEERLPPGDTVLGALLAQAWTEPASLTPNDTLDLAPEGRLSLARGVSPGDAVEESFMEPRRGDRAVTPADDSEGSHPGQTTFAPTGPADELADWTVSNPARQQRAALASSADDLHATYRPTDTGDGFTAFSPTQPFWVIPTRPAVDPTHRAIRSAVPLIAATSARGSLFATDSRIGTGPDTHLVTPPSGPGPNEDISFITAGAYPVGQTPGMVVSGDFNRDHIPDLAVLNQDSDAVSILYGQGDGTFIAGNVLGVGRNPFGLATADLNGDGVPDLVVSNNGSGSLSIWLGNPNLPGQFQPAPTVQVGGDLRQLAVGDVDGDHIPDIAVADAASNQIALLRGNGNGTFQPPQYFGTGGTAPTDPKIADFNGDGIPDLVTTNSGSGSIAVLLGNGDGTFQEPRTFALGVNPFRLTVGDFNGDGVPDLAVTHAPDSSTDLDILLGRGDGTFELAQRLPLLSQSPFVVTAADFDGDKVLDLAVANTGTVAILRGRGDGTFDQARYFAGGGRGGIVAADFNGDGLPDLAVTRNDTGPLYHVFVLLNNTPQPDNQLQPIYPVAVDRNIVYYDGPGFIPTRHILDVYRPIRDAKFPVLVFNFGNFGGSAKDTYGFLGQIFAGQGIGVVIANRRVSPNETPYVEQMIDPARSLAWTFDHIATFGGDPEKVFLSGHSVGGWLAGLLSLDGQYLEALGHSPDELRGAIPMSGTFHLPSAPAGWQAMLENLSEEEQLALSPITHIGEHSIPFVVANGTDEPPVIDQTTRFYDALVEAGYDVGRVQVPGATHNVVTGDLILPDNPLRIVLQRFIAEHS
jgi:acetyl esterase/lipase